MAETLIIAAATSLLTACLTWLVAWWVYRRHLQARFEQQLLQAQEAFERRVQSGVKAAGEELLPAFREQVTLGFQDAIKGTATAGLVEDSARMVSRSAEVLEDGMKSLFGVKPKR